MDISSIKGKAGSALSRLQGTVHKTLKGWYRLKDFIRLYRKCKTRAEERALLSKEAAGIRTALKSSECPSDQRWHSLAKLLFIHLQGMSVHYGQVECMKLAAACNASGSVGTGMTKGRSQLNAKRLGYLGATMLLDDRQQTLFLLTNTLKQDLVVSECGVDDEYVVRSALNCLACLPSTELYMELADEVINIIVTEKARRNVRKRAITCFAAMLNRIPDIHELVPAGLLERLLSEKDHAVQLGGCYMIQGMRSALDDETVQRLAGFIVRQLNTQSANCNGNTDYTIGMIDDPTLIVVRLKTLHKLQSNASEIVSGLEQFIVGQRNPKKNAEYAVLYEAISTLSFLAPPSLAFCVSRLSDFLECDDSNLRMVGLELLKRVTTFPRAADDGDGRNNRNSGVAALAKHRGLILQCLKRSAHEDPTIVRLAVDLALGLIVDKTALKIVLPEVLLVEESWEDVGERLLSLLNTFADRADEEYIHNACAILDKYIPNECPRRETIVYIIIERLSKTGNILLKSIDPRGIAASEVVIWLEGRHGKDTETLEKYLRNESLLADELACGYVISACARMAGRNVAGTEQILSLLISHKKTSVNAKERALQMKHMEEHAEKFSECLQAVPDPLESFAQSICMGEDDEFKDVVEEGNGDSRGKRVFEGRGITIFANRDDHNEITFTMINPIQHPAQPTNKVSLQVALPKGVSGQLKPPNGDTLPPFSNKSIIQILLLDSPSQNDSANVKIRCRIKYSPAALSEPQMDTFDTVL